MSEIYSNTQKPTLKHESGIENLILDSVYLNIKPYLLKNCNCYVDVPSAQKYSLLVGYTCSNNACFEKYNKRPYIRLWHNCFMSSVSRCHRNRAALFERKGEIFTTRWGHLTYPQTRQEVLVEMC